MNRERSLDLLLIEDNPGDARYIEEILRDATGLPGRTMGNDGGSTAMRHQSTETGGELRLTHEMRLKDGLERVEDATPDAVLLDLNLPDSTGLETLETMLAAVEGTPVIVLTGHRDRETGIDAVRQGAEEYLVKDEITSDLLIRSVYHAIERKIHQRELKRYETLIQESTDVNAILEPDRTIRYLTPSVEHVLGYEPEELVGDDVFGYVHPDDRERVEETFSDILTDSEHRPTAEFRVQHNDGSWVVLEARGRNLLDDPMIDGLVIYTHEITERKENERQLERQREQLEALNQLNQIVQEITRAVIDRQTRDGIEETVCELLAASESYQFAWIGEVDTSTERVQPTTEAGASEYLDSITISVNPEDQHSSGPTGKAVRTQETQTVQDVLHDPEYEPWHGAARKYGFRSSAAIPIVHEETLFGVLNVYTERRYAFAGPERTVISQLGEIIGHAIAAVERKRALMSDELVELEFQITDVFEEMDADVTTDERISIERAVPVNDEFRVFGTTTPDGIAALEDLTEQLPTWKDLSVNGERVGTIEFEVLLSEPPIISAVTTSGGRVENAVFENGDLWLTVHLPQGADVRELIDTIKQTHPTAEPVARRQITRSTESAERIERAWANELTDRQRAALQVAYFSGFFEWPRKQSGEEVAESLDISPATFSQHMRIAQDKLLGALFDELVDVDDERNGGQ